MAKIRKTFAIFTTDNGHTHKLQYTARGVDAQRAFNVFDANILSDTGEEEGWDWHLYEIPDELHLEDNDDAIYDYVANRPPQTITS